MLQVIVQGKGMIPRLNSLAPRLTPFLADITMINTIMNTPGLKISMIHPDNGKVIALNKSNLKKYWDLYRNDKYEKKTVTPTTSSKVVAPVVTNIINEEPKVDTPSVPEVNSVEEAKAVDVKVDNKPANEPTIKPVITSDNRNNNNQKNNKK